MSRTTETTPRALTEPLDEGIWKGRHVVGIYRSTGSCFVARLDRQMPDGSFDTTVIGTPMTKTEAAALYAAHRTLTTQKEFAMAVKDSPYSAKMFTMRKEQDAGRTLSAGQWLADERHFPYVLKLLGVRETISDEKGEE